MYGSEKRDIEPENRIYTPQWRWKTTDETQRMEWVLFSDQEPLAFGTKWYVLARPYFFDSAGRIRASELDRFMACSALPHPEATRDYFIPGESGHDCPHAERFWHSKWWPGRSNRVWFPDKKKLDMGILWDAHYFFAGNNNVRPLGFTRHTCKYHIWLLDPAAWASLSTCNDGPPTSYIQLGYLVTIFCLFRVRWIKKHIPLKVK